MGDLGRQLDDFLQAVLGRCDGKISAALRHNEAAAADRHAMRVGDTAPDFTLPDQQGKPVSLSAALAEGPVVLSFFRGGWCPFSSIALRAMNKALPGLKRAHATVLAISPQTPRNTVATAERNVLKFSVLSDADNAVARQYGVLWRLGPEARELFERLGHDIPRLNASKHWELPVTAGYVIAPDGRIAFAQVDPLVTHQMEPADALAAVRALQEEPVK